MTVERELRLAELAAVCWLSTCQTGVAGSRPFYVAAFGRVVIGGGPTPRLSVVHRSAGRCGGLGAVSDAALNHPFTEREIVSKRWLRPGGGKLPNRPTIRMQVWTTNTQLGHDVNHDREEGQRSRRSRRFGRAFGCRPGCFGRECGDRRECRSSRQRDHGRQCCGGRQRGDGRQHRCSAQCGHRWQCCGAAVSRRPAVSRSPVARPQPGALRSPEASPPAEALG